MSDFGLEGGKPRPDRHRGVSYRSKAEYVRHQKQDRDHECHWPGCTKQVPPALWGCRKHWFKLPKVLRDKIWAAYQIGQEKTMTPSREYVAVAREVQDWIKENYPNG